MHHSSPRNTFKKSAGFTLIEMLVVAPIVILALGGFISLMVTMVGDVMATHDENTMMYDMQDALARIEDDVSISNQFLLTSGTLPVPQGSDVSFAGTAAFTTTANSLVLSSFATDRNPSDSLRQVVYFKDQPNPCDDTKSVNPILYTKIIYYISNGSLWRRTVLPTYNTDATPDARTVCAAPWQQNSCSVGYSATLCKTNDIKLMSDITNMTINYYDSPGSTTDLTAAGADSATTIKVTLTGQKTTAGHPVNVSLSVRAKKLNIDTKEIPPIDFNYTLHPVDVDVIPSEGSTTFTSSTNMNTATYQWQVDTGSGWSNVSNGTNYSGATTKNLTVSNFTTTWNNATQTYSGWNGYQYRVVATYAGQPLNSDPATLNVSNWKPISFHSDWTAWGSPYNSIGVTKTSAGVVKVKGLIKKWTAATQYDIIGVLPPGYRPSGRLIFQALTAPDVAGRIDVLPTGEILYIFGDVTNSWISLESINFIPAGTAYARTGLTFTNGWTNYGAPFENASFSVDSIGRVHIQGLVRPGTITNGTQIATNITPRPSRYMHVPARSDPQGNVGVDQNLGVVAKGAGTVNGHLALHTMWYPSSFAGWSSFVPQNGWIPHDDGVFFTAPGYAKGSDNLVRIKGLIRNGNTAAGIVVTTLPAGFRPAQRILTEADCNPNVECRVDVLPNGNVELYSSNSGWTSLDNVTFLAEQ